MIPMGIIASSIMKGAAGGGDPSFAYVSALLHFDGPDGSTTFTDVTSKIWTPTLSAEIVTAQSKFGGSSGRLTGGSKISTPAHDDFAYGTGDFTWEFWLRLATLGGNQYALDHSLNGGTVVYNSFLRYYNSTIGVGGPLYTTGGGALLINTWYHIAVARESNITRFFVDGVLKSSGTDNHNYGSLAPQIGAYSTSSNSLNGWVDDFRITKGVARYTAAFTPPAAAFPDS